MTGGGLAAADRGDSAEEIHVLPAQILDFDASTSGRNGEHRRAMRDHPLRTARGGLKQRALQIGRQNLRYCAAILWECLYVFGDGIPDLGPFQHAAEDAGFHVYRPTRDAGVQPRLLITGNVLGFEPQRRLLAEMFHERSKPLCLELHGALGNMRLTFFEIDPHRFVKRFPGEFAPRLRGVLALLDFGNAILFELFRLPLVGCVQRLAITNAVDRYVEVPVTDALVDHAAPFQAGFLLRPGDQY